MGLKWPNDLWLGGAAGDRKLGGILVETASFVAPQAAQAVTLQTNTSTARYVVVGIGINVLPRSPWHGMPPAAVYGRWSRAWTRPPLLRIVPPLVADAAVVCGLWLCAHTQPRFAARDAAAGPR